MWLSHTDSEVACFHPVCESALNEALKRLKRQEEYEILHHERVGTLEMDFAVRNRRTKQYLCVFEVKRTPADVHSSRYQFQAMSYVQMLFGELERPFYVLTNLEYSFAFRYDAAKPRVFQQMLAPGLLQAGSFQEDTKSEFLEKLTKQFSELLKAFLQDSYRYAVTLEQFAVYMGKMKESKKAWKSSLVLLLYEYIRGAFLSVGRKDLPHDVRAFRSNVEQICKEAIRINFGEIFSYQSEEFEAWVSMEDGLLFNLFEFGRQNRSADSVAQVLYEIASEGREHDNGEVMTDLELGRFVSLFAKCFSGELSKEQKVCDPCAGSGNLISTSVELFSLEPKQIKANDIDPYLAELLSLRLGLMFPRLVDRWNSAQISISDVTELSLNYFEDVAAILLNPPFISGISCADRKKQFAKKITEISGREEAATDIGQMPLSGLFLELICEYAKEDTVISCILPNSYLTSRGPEAVAIRELLTGSFGLCLIFDYPTDGLFDQVVVGTSIFVGKKGRVSDEVLLISSYDPISNIDLHRLSEALSKSQINHEFAPLISGIMARLETRETLLEKLEDGWRGVNNEMKEALTFVERYLASCDKLVFFEDTRYEMPRGRIGNSGASDLLYVGTRSEFYEEYLPLLMGHTRPGLRNSKYKNFLVGGGDVEFLDITHMAEGVIQTIVGAYAELPVKSGRQAKNKKTTRDYVSILKRESKCVTPEHSVLIPRALRRMGAVYMTDRPTYVSTNFITLEGLCEREALIIATWMSTIFYQLICEASSKDNTGLRKMEQADIKKTLVPTIDRIEDSAVEKMRACAAHLEFLDLSAPKIRDIDRVWADVLFCEEGQKRLEAAERLLLFLANRRNRG